MGSTDTKFTKPTTDATTTDGFCVGRPVRSRWNHELRGEITAKATEYADWHVRWDDGRQQLVLQGDLVLLPEPDAPATPEPAPADDGRGNFKPGDRVKHKVIGLKGRLKEFALCNPSGARTWFVEWDNGEVLTTPPSSLELLEPTKPSYYAKLRDAGCEPWTVIRGCMSREKAVAYHQGTAIAYLIRAEHKHTEPDDDIRKAHAHLAEAVAILDSTITSPTTT